MCFDNCVLSGSVISRRNATAFDCWILASFSKLGNNFNSRSYDVSEVTADLISVVSRVITLERTESSAVLSSVAPRMVPPPWDRGATYTYRRYLAVNNRVIRAARVTRREVRSTVDAADWTEFVPIAVAGSFAGRLEAGDPAETFVRVSVRVAPHNKPARSRTHFPKLDRLLPRSRTRENDQTRALSRPRYRAVQLNNINVK